MHSFLWLVKFVLCNLGNKTIIWLSNVPHLQISEHRRNPLVYLPAVKKCSEWTPTNPKQGGSKKTRHVFMHKSKWHRSKINRLGGLCLPLASAQALCRWQTPVAPAGGCSPCCSPSQASPRAPKGTCSSPGSLPPSHPHLFLSGGGANRRCNLC